MYVVLDGSVTMRKGEIQVATVEKGQHFGEMSLLDRSTRSLTATAETTCRAILIRRKDFYTIIKKEPPLAVKLLWSFVQVLAARLRKTTADLSGALQGESPPEAGNLFDKDED
jgi:CRP-like cAMP-binding protein